MPVYAWLPRRGHMLRQAEAALKQNNQAKINQLNANIQPFGYQIVFDGELAHFQQLPPPNPNQEI